MATNNMLHNASAYLKKSFLICGIKPHLICRMTIHIKSLSFCSALPEKKKFLNFLVQSKVVELSRLSPQRLVALLQQVSKDSPRNRTYNSSLYPASHLFRQFTYKCIFS